MKKLIYPAVFHKEKDSYWVEFPDLEGCQSYGGTINEVYENAKEALEAYCVTLLEQQRELNSPSDISSIKADDFEFTSLVEADLIKKSQAVKKTLTIPSWLNSAALEQGVNFSELLQNALKQELKIAQ